jgi:hypothetical protein
MDISLTDVTVHIDETLTDQELQAIEAELRRCQGVVSVHVQPGRKHLMLVEYNPGQVGSSEVLDAVTSLGVHAELVGL